MNIKPWFCQDCREKMGYNKEFRFFKCPDCGIEVWLPESNPTKEARQVAEELSDVIIPIPRKGGVGSGKGRAKKHLLQKKSTKRLYEELCGG